MLKSKTRVSSGYEPMTGDWVQATYFINPTQSSTQAQSVAPLRYSSLNQVAASLIVLQSLFHVTLCYAIPSRVCRCV